MPFLSFCRCLLISSLLVAPVYSQAHLPTTVKTSEGPIQIPQARSILQQNDPTAITVIADYLTAAGLHTWRDLLATGVVTSTQDGNVSSKAVFSVSGPFKYRLDERTAKGLSSTRIDQELGKVQDSQGKTLRLHSVSASYSLFPFALPKLFLAEHKNSSLQDLGVVRIGDLSLHQIRFERIALGLRPDSNKPNTSVIDFYFDPISHLLIKSAVSIATDENQRALMLSVVSYSDYRRVGTALIPFRFVETLEGEDYRILQLDDVQLHPTFEANHFSF